MYTLKKEERLCNKKLIDELFHNGSSFLCYPYKASWMLADAAQLYPAQVLFAVSKKRFKKATDRNRIKRISREVFRLNKQEYLHRQLNQAEKKIVLSLAYIGKELPEFAPAQKKMLKLLKQLCVEVGV